MIAGDGRHVLVTQRIAIDTATGEARDALAHDWALWLNSHGLTAVPVPNALEQPVALLDAIQPIGLILSGGGDVGTIDVSPSGPLGNACVRDLAPETCRDRTESLLLAAAIRRRLPVLAVCRGMQFINAFFHGAISPRIAAPNGPHARPGTSHLVRLEPTLAPGCLPDRQREAPTRSFHDHGVLAGGVARNLLAFASTADGAIEGLRHNRLAIIGVQWHPEREPDHPWSTALLQAAFPGTLA